MTKLHLGLAIVIAVQFLGASGHVRIVKLRSKETLRERLFREGRIGDYHRELVEVSDLQGQSGSGSLSVRLMCGFASSDPPWEPLFC